jgi:hypothetical protein
MALKNIPGELDDRHPATSRYMHRTNNLHVALHNIVYTDSPIGVTRIAVSYASLNWKGKSPESVTVITGEE